MFSKNREDIGTFEWSILFSNHCERPGRILAIWKGLKTRKLDRRCTMIPSRLATKEEILLVHSEKFYDELELTKALSRLDLKKLQGTPRSVEYTNVREISFHHAIISFSLHRMFLIMH